MTLALDEAPRECAICSSTSDLVLAGEQDVCRDCIPELAWHCWKCNRDEEETIVVVTSYGPELFCSKCHTGVDPVFCFLCECQIAVGDLRRDEDGELLCSECAEDESCRVCGGSGGGDHPGIRCTSCRGTGVDIEIRRRRR